MVIMTVKRENTIVLDFRNVIKKPQNVVIHRWIKENLKFTVDQVLCIQFDHIKNKVYIKLVSSTLVQLTVRELHNKLFFKDEDGELQQVFISEEEDEIAVRIYDFPIELSNEKIKETLSRYGKVKSIRNEKWIGDEDLYMCESGIRTVIISMKSKIPSYLKIDGYTSLVTYPNQLRTCMICDEPGHVRKNCPLKPGNKILEIRRPAAPFVEIITTESGVHETYANKIALKSGNSIKQHEETINEEITVFPVTPTPDRSIIDSHTQLLQNQQKSENKAKDKKRKKSITNSSEEERKVPPLKISLKSKDVKGAGALHKSQEDTEHMSSGNDSEDQTY